MKKIAFTIILTVIFTLGLNAQNRSINFEQTKSWAAIVEKATNEQKLIFVDCYTEWCGPCKMMSAQIFTQDDVADLFNENFINAKFEMEKDKDGVANAKLWNITAYPTLLFIDPRTQQVIQKVTGADKEQLMAGARGVIDMLNSRNKLPAMTERYNKGNFGPAFLGEFVETLRQAGMTSEMEQVLANYFDERTPEQLATSDNWKLIEKYGNDPLTQPLKTVLDNAELFYDISGYDRQTIDTKIGDVILSTTLEFVQNPNMQLWEQGRYNAFIGFLETYDGPVKSMAAIWINTSMLAQRQEWDRLLQTMQVVREQELLSGDQFAQYMAFFCQETGKGQKKQAVDKTIKWLDEMIAEYTGETIGDYYSKAAITQARLMLTAAAERYGAAQKAQKELEEYVTKIKALTD